MEEERNVITFFCFNGANCHGVGNSEMVYVLVRTLSDQGTRGKARVPRTERVLTNLDADLTKHARKFEFGAVRLHD